MLRIVVIVLLFFCSVVKAQIIPNPNSGMVDPMNPNRQDTVSNPGMIDIQLSGKTHYTDYKIIDYKNDTTYFDTTLTINKYYKFNYLRQDNFELLPFHNQGQTYNHLAYDFNTVSLYPNMGARAMHFNFYTVKDINYFKVPTPTSELFYRTGLTQGQVLDALLTLNTSERTNFSIAYKGLRSLGKYRSALASQGNMRFTFLHSTKNNRYSIKGHVVAQDLTNDENGGLTDLSLQYFITRDRNFTDRERLETLFTDGENTLRGNRYFFTHRYNLWQRYDTLKKRESYLRIGHTLNYERKHHGYNQTAANSIFGNAFGSTIRDKNSFYTFYNQAYAALKSPIVLGEVSFNIANYNYLYKYNSAAILNNTLIPNKIDGNIISAGGTWKTNYRKFNIYADAATIISGNLTGNYLKATAAFKQDSLFTFKGSFLANTRSPNLNFELNQSNYIAYNWKNNLKNERYRTLFFELNSDKILDASAQISQIDNYTYFSDATNATNYQPKPLQADKTINYLKLKIGKTLTVGKFSLENTVMYQKVAQGSSVFKVPELVTRNSLYFTDYLFKGDPLYLQTGITLNYFTKYYANAYNPVLAEFYLQNQQKIGGYPILDFFINAQVQRTRLYLNFEHANTFLNKKNDYFTAPRYPYRDFVIRFGLVWNFFI
ncbi:MAG: hypothetical protein CR989_04440 [Flavobacteriales bacterium]|nr:MAG: hypothetical protein CR989_04440 [Flavobacteriales bacterium]